MDQFEGKVQEFQGKTKARIRDIVHEKFVKSQFVRKVVTDAFPVEVKVATTTPRFINRPKLQELQSPSSKIDHKREYLSIFDDYSYEKNHISTRPAAEPLKRKHINWRNELREYDSLPSISILKTKNKDPTSDHISSHNLLLDSDLDTMNSCDNDSSFLIDADTDDQTVVISNNNIGNSSFTFYTQQNHDKYFGDNSKLDFYDRYHSMTNQLNTLGLPSMQMHTNQTGLRHERTRDKVYPIDDSQSLLSRSVDGKSRFSKSVSFKSIGKSKAKSSIIGGDSHTALGNELQIWSHNSSVILKRIDEELLTHRASQVRSNANDNSHSHEDKDAHALGHTSVVSAVSNTSHSYNLNELDKCLQLILPDSELAELLQLQVQTSLTPSPRSKYAAACIRDGLAPLPSLILRKSYSKDLKFAHFRIGDTMGNILAESLSELPVVESIDLTDNMLTQSSLPNLLKSAFSIKALKEINLSQNIIDSNVCFHISQFLSNAKYLPFEKLSLSSCGISIVGFERIFHSINSNLIELDISNNLRGSGESLSALSATSLSSSSSSSSSISPSHSIENAANNINNIGLKNNNYSNSSDPFHIVKNLPGQTIGNFLTSNACQLKVLNISWNSIRFTNACKLAAKIPQNSTLTHLDLSDNGLGNEAGIILGSGLANNKTLSTLLLGGNDIHGSGCFVICNSLYEHKSMRSLVLDNNPIGESGITVVIFLCSSLGTRINITTRNCNISIKDDKISKLINLQKITGHYNFYLHDPLQYALACFVVKYVAYHSNITIAHCFYYPRDELSHEDRRFLSPYSDKKEKPRKSTKNKKQTGDDGSAGDKTKTEVRPTSAKFDMHQFILPLVAVESKKLELHEEEKKIWNELEVLRNASSDAEMCEKLFIESDVDNSGELDAHELAGVLVNLGLATKVGAPSLVQEMMDVYDVDGSGLIEFQEFKAYIQSQHTEAVARMREITTIPIHVCIQDETTNSQALAVNVQPYTPPSQGILKLIVVEKLVTKSRCHVISKFDMENIINLGSQSKGLINDDKLLLLLGLKYSKLRHREAIKLFGIIYHQVGDLSKSVALILPLLYDFDDSRIFISKITHGDQLTINKIKKMMGNHVNPILGVVNGFYSLDLGHEMHRDCFFRLLLCSTRINSSRQQHVAIGRSMVRDLSLLHVPEDEDFMISIGDTSQHQNWSCFRNEIFNGKKMTINIEDYADHIPEGGIIEFDFVTCLKPSISEPCISDKTFINLLSNICLLNPNCENKGFDKLKYFKEKHYDIIHSYLHNSIKVSKIRKLCDDFYDNLKIRSVHQQYEEKNITKAATPRNRRAGHTPDKNAKGNGRSSFKNPTLSPQKIEKELQVISSEQENEDEDMILADDLGRLEDLVLTNFSQNQISKYFHLTEQKSSNARMKGFTKIATADHADVAFELFQNESKKKNRKELPKKDNNSTSAPSTANAVGQPKIEYGDLEATYASNSMEINPKQETIAQYRTFLFAFLVDKNHNIPTYYMAAYFFKLIKDTFFNFNLKSRHLAVIVQCFRTRHGGTVKSKIFGSFIVDLVVSLFGCINDVHNFDIVLSSLTSLENACVICRIGVLNIFNPMNFGNYLEFNLNRTEERIASKILLYLASLEKSLQISYSSSQHRPDSALPSVQGSQPSFGTSSADEDDDNVSRVSSLMSKSGDGTDSESENDRGQKEVDTKLRVLEQILSSKDPVPLIEEALQIFMNENTLPTEGILCAQSNAPKDPDESDADHVNIFARNAMLQLVLHDADRLFIEDLEENIAQLENSSRLIFQHIHENSKLWNEYLVPGCLGASVNESTDHLPEN